MFSRCGWYIKFSYVSATGYANSDSAKLVKEVECTNDNLASLTRLFDNIVFDIFEWFINRFEMFFAHENIFILCSALKPSELTLKTS
jgi:hypothetical protein